MLAFLARGVPVIAVHDNHTTMRVSAADLQQPLSDQHQRIDRFMVSDASAMSNIAENKGANSSMGQIIHARSYAEAAGIIVALKNGILVKSTMPHVPPTAITAL